MNKIFKTYRLALMAGIGIYLLSASTPLWAQLPTDQITVITTKERVTRNAIKLGENPKIKEDSVRKLDLDYKILEKEVETDYQVSLIKPARLGKEPLKKLYHSYVKAGFGNYTTPFFELSVNKLRSRKSSMGVFLHHLSSTGKLDDVGFPGFSENHAKVFGSRYFKAYTLNGSVEYQRNVNHFYGFDTQDTTNFADTLSKDDIRQRFSYIGAHVDLVQSKKNKPKWLNLISLDYYNYMDLYDAVENNAQLNFGLNKGIKKNGLFTFDALVDYYNHKFPTDQWDNFIFSLKPMVGMEGDRGKVMIGASLAFDVYSDTSATHVYPHAYGHYSIVEDILEFYGEVSGSIGKNSFRSLTMENPFLLSNGNLKNTSNQVILKGGLRGAFAPKLTFNVSVSQGFHEDMPFFVNDTSFALGNQFDVVYDDVSITNVRGEIGFQSTEKLSILARVDYFNYTMDKEEKPWHTPNFRGQINAKYNIADKIIVSADVYYLHEQFARTFTTDTTLAGPIVVEAKKIDYLIDANLGVEYRFSKAFSAFARFNNVAGFRYYRWNQYPSQRFNFLGGLTYSF